MKCFLCETSLPRGATVCASCGELQPERGAELVDPSVQPMSRTTALWAFVALSFGYLTGLAVGGFALTNNATPEETVRSGGLMQGTSLIVFLCELFALVLGIQIARTDRAHEKRGVLLITLAAMGLLLALLLLMVGFLLQSCSGGLKDFSLPAV